MCVANPLVAERVVNRWRWLAKVLPGATIGAWWVAWLSFWAFFGDQHDPDYQRDQRSWERDDHTGLDDRGGGNFWAAGCGSESD